MVQRDPLAARCGGGANEQVKHWGRGPRGLGGAPKAGLGWGEWASPPSEAPLPLSCLLGAPSWGEGGLVWRLFQVPLLRSSLSSLGCPLHAPQLRHCRLPQGPKARAPWSSSPFCLSCWLSSSRPSLLCSSTPGKWTGSLAGTTSYAPPPSYPEDRRWRGCVCRHELLLLCPSLPARGPVGDGGGRGVSTLERAPLAPWRQQPELRVGGLAADTPSGIHPRREWLLIQVLSFASKLHLELGCWGLVNRRCLQLPRGKGKAGVGWIWGREEESSRASVSPNAPMPRAPSCRTWRGP